MGHGETHSFSVDVACAVGTNAAVIYNHIAFWCRTNRAKGIEEMHVDGHWWTSFSVKDASGLYPYLTERQVSYAIGKLVDSGLVVEANHNDSKWDHRKWYRVAGDDDAGPVGIAEANAEKQEKANCYTDECREVIDYLRERSGNRTRHVDSNYAYIRALLRGSEPVTVDDMKAVVDVKSAQWRHDPRMSKYLRPSTLFSKGHFFDYLAEVGGGRHDDGWDKGW